MGARIEEQAAKEDLYASTFIREIVEVHVIEQEQRKRTYEVDRRQSNAEKLRGELIGLNEDIMSLTGKRDHLALRLKRAAEEEGREVSDEEQAE